ncbi:MAG: glycosyltransferase [Acidimicrobiales bacterium]
MTDLSVIVPTRNEASNVGPFVLHLSGALANYDHDWEIIFVDDSDDSTPQVIERLAAGSDHRILLLHRQRGEREGGLGGAVREGFLKAAGRALVVMDGDLQHPPEAVPLLVALVVSGEAEIVAASRYGKAGNRGGLGGPYRQVVAIACRQLAHLLVPKSRSLSDPMSGFFALDRSVVDGVELRPDGYKILLEVVARGNWHCARNVDYSFSRRLSGESKAGLREGLVFLRHVWHLSRDAEAEHPKARRP